MTSWIWLWFFYHQITVITPGQSFIGNAARYGEYGECSSDRLACSVAHAPDKQSYRLTVKDKNHYDSFFKDIYGWQPYSKDKSFKRSELRDEILQRHLKFEWGSPWGFRPLKEWFGYKSPIEEEMSDISNTLKDIRRNVDRIVNASSMIELVLKEHERRRTTK